MSRLAPWRLVAAMLLAALAGGCCHCPAAVFPETPEECYDLLKWTVARGAGAPARDPADLGYPHLAQVAPADLLYDLLEYRMRDHYGYFRIATVGWPYIREYATDFIHTEYDGVAAELVAVRPDPDRPGRDAPLPEGVVARLRFTTPPPGTKDRFDYVQFVRELPPAPERMVKQGRVVVASHRWHLTEYQPYSHTWRRVRERLRTGAPPSAVAPAPADGAPSGGQGAGQAGDWFKPDDLDPGK